MMKYWLVGVSAFTMMTGVALAQGTLSDTTSSTQSTTTTIAPQVGAYSATKSQKTIDSNGTETDRNQSYSSSAGGSRASSSSRTTGPNGSQTNMQRDERTVSPYGDSTTTNSTSTTTVR
jgi:hypothetical protein